MKLKYEKEIALWVEFVKNAPYTYEDAKKVWRSLSQRDREPTIIEELAGLNAEYADCVLEELKERL